MRAAVRTLKTMLVISVAAAGGCHKSQPQDQNVALGNAAGPAEIEALPPDESSTTSSNELANGSDNADVNVDMNNSD